PWVQILIPVSVEPHATLDAALRLLCYVLVFLLAVSFCRLGQSDVLLVLVIRIGLFQAAFWVVQNLTESPYIFTYLRKSYPDGAAGTYINRNHFAGLLEMVLPFLLANLIVSHRGSDGSTRGWRRALSSSSLHPLRTAILFALAFVALLFSKSRAGIIA